MVALEITIHPHRDTAHCPLPTAHSSHANAMPTPSWHVPRRTFLRGASAALALPMLDAMAPLTRRARASDSGALAPTPTRFAALYFPNGAFMDNWVPKQTGADYE